MPLVPGIRVRDTQTGHSHFVGTDSHDHLLINSDGSLDYYNLQCGEGTGPHGMYRFVADRNDLPHDLSIEMISITEFLVGIAEDLDLGKYMNIRAFGDLALQLDYMLHEAQKQQDKELTKTLIENFKNHPPEDLPF